MKRILLIATLGLGTLFFSACSNTGGEGVCPITGARGPRPVATESADAAACAAKPECCVSKKACCKPNADGTLSACCKPKCDKTAAKCATDKSKCPTTKAKCCSTDATAATQATCCKPKGEGEAAPAAAAPAVQAASDALPLPSCCAGAAKQA